MRLSRTLVAAFWFSLLTSLSAARADQPRDWMVGPQPGATNLNLDVVFPGVQAMVEYRKPIYGVVNELWIKANALYLLPIAESQLDVDLRLVILSIGGSVGFRDNFRGIEVAPGATMGRKERRIRELSGNYEDVTNAFGELRAQLALPFNDHALFWSVNGVRFEGGPDRIFDWRLGVPRDSGMYVNSNNTLFFKHRFLGALGPQLQVLNFAFDGVRRTQVNYGFTYTVRPGFLRKNDLLFLSALFNSGSASDAYGMHLFYGPFNVQLAYRLVFELHTQGTQDEERSAP
jgi:hypothetical protein